MRKVLGGGMRQIGIIAAAGQIAMDNMIERLEDDHRRAYKIAKGITKLIHTYLKTNNNVLHFQ